MAIRFDQIELSSSGHNYYPVLQGVNSAQYLQITTSHGYTQIGANNSSYSHFYTDRGAFYFNQPISFDGNIAGYDGNETASFATYYDSNNTSYFVNPASNSTLLEASIGTTAGVPGGYRLNMGGNIDMNAHQIDYVSQLHFNDNVRFYDNGNDSDLNYKFGDTGYGQIRFLDGSGNFEGSLYTESGYFGTLSNDGTWAVQSANTFTNIAHEVRSPKFIDFNDTNYYADFNHSDRAVKTYGSVSIGTVGHLGLGDTTHPKVVYPGKEASFDASGSSTGQIVIDLPGTLAHYDMTYMEIHIYEYSSDAASKIIIGGHNWNSGGNSGTSNTQWHNNGVQVIGSFSRPIYLGRRNDGSNERRCIALGETTSTWSYVTVHVAKVHGACYYTDSIDWMGDWNVAQTTNTSYFTKNPTTNWNANTSITLRTNGRFNANFVTAASDMKAPLYYDSNNTSYYTNPAGTSVMNDIEIEDYLYHKGDTDTYLYFEPDSIKLRTGGSDRLTLTNTQAGFSTDVVISSAGTGGSPTLRINNLSHTTFNHGIEVMNANLVQGESEIIVVGKTTNTKNSGWLGYYWHANASDDNFVSIGHWGNNHLFRVYGSGSVVATTNMQAPIFYDSANTTYYLDPASTSTGLKTAGEAEVKSLRLLNGFTLVQGSSNYARLGSWLDVSNIGLYSSHGSGNGAHFYPNTSSDYGTWRINGSRSGYNGISFGGSSSTANTLMSAADGSAMGLFNDTDNEWYLEGVRNSYLKLYYDGGEQARTDNGFFFANNQMRSPIFYDSANTTYYLDPADTGDALKIRGSIRIDSTHSGGNLFLYYQHSATDTGNSGTLTGWVSEPGITYADAGIGANIHQSGPYYGRAINSGYGVYINFKKTSGEMLFKNTTGTSGNSAGAGTTRMTIGASGDVTASNSSRAPIFYDSDNTNYYVNPASGSVLGGTVTIHPDADSAVSIQDGGTNAILITAHTGDELYLGSNSASKIRLYSGGAVESYGDFRAPIFYDSNDTGYYVNPAGTSNLNVVAAGTLNVVNVNASQGVKAPNQRTNYAAHRWAVGNTNPQLAAFDGSFTFNGGTGENSIAYKEVPSGGRGLVWVAANNDSTSNDDGGWNKIISNLSDDKSYISIVYVKRASSSTNGTFYHGCNGSHTLNMDGTANTNPYFTSFGIGSLPQDVWCVSIGIIQANNDSNQNSWSDIDGVYRLDTGQRIVDLSTFKMKDGSTTQTHRVYLYYSTDSNAELHFYNPGFYEINGQEPTLNEILNRDKNLKFTGVLNAKGNIKQTGTRFIVGDSTDYWGAENTTTINSWRMYHDSSDDLIVEVNDSGLGWYTTWKWDSAAITRGNSLYFLDNSNFYVGSIWYSLRKGRISEHLSVGNGTGSQVDTTKAALQIYGNNNTDGTVRLGPHSSKGSNFSHIHYGSNGDWYIRPAADDGKIVIADSDADQSVGVGTSSPSAKLDVEANTDSGYIAEFRNLHQTDGNGVFIKCNAQDSGMVILDTQDGGGASILKVTPAVVTVGQNNQLRASRNTTTDSVGAAAASFIDHNTGSGNRATIAMEANSYQGAKHIEFYQGSSVNGSISSGYNATGFNTSSDYRLKENVNDLSDALTKVDLLLPKTFTWKGGDDNIVIEGFLAHEAQEVVPQAVTGTKDESDENGKAVYQGIDQAKLVPLLTAAIKELKAQNEDLLDRVKALENK